MEILYAKKARISKICINMEEETGEKTFSYSTCALLHEAACVNFTHAMEFFFSDRERDAWRRSASREAWFIDWHRTDQYRTPCIFNEAGSSCRWRAPRTLPIANAARYEVSCQSTTRRLYERNRSSKTQFLLHRLQFCTRSHQQTEY